jgi:hypothetical protein
MSMMADQLKRHAAAASAGCFAVIILWACVSEEKYEQQTRQLQQTESRAVD